jgi:DivIVA domain-containing protein
MIFNPAESQQAAVVVSREGGHWRDRLRKYNIRIDGETVSRLSEFQTETFPLEPGPHVIQAKIDWGTSQKLSLNLPPGQICYLTCAPGSILGLVIPRVYIDLRVESKASSDFVRLAAEQVRNATFKTTLFGPGYRPEDVRRLLERVAIQLEARQSPASAIASTALGTTRRGYKIADVSSFLNRLESEANKDGSTPPPQ